MQEEQSFTNVILRPHWMQYGLCKLPDIAFCLATTIAIPLIENNIIRILLAAVTVIIFFCLIYAITDMYRIRYIITGEQILYKHGVFSYTTDYIELYRVYDYQQCRSPLQQMTGLKTVIVLANDRINPSLNILGMENNRDIVDIIRRRVEYNKLRKNVYEIANRY